MKVLLPTSLSLDLPVDQTVDGVTYVSYAPDAPVPDAHTDADALVAWGNTSEQLADTARRLTALRWVQALAAGPDAILAAGFAPEVVVTSGRSLHDGPVSEHTLALALSAARRLDLMVDAQRDSRWAGELGGSQSGDRATYPGLGTLAGAAVTVWGFGSIGQALAPLLQMLGADVVGVATTAGERSGFPVITEDELPARLAETDLLVAILPATPETEKIVSEKVFAALPDHAWVVNVGRGATLDEVALEQALRAGTLGGAALDVVATEPLPASSTLWETPNLILTPHAAGGRPQGATELVAENVAAFREGRTLRNVVSR
ncbi:phosphoglycerate dehydrogenase-like oxidoreductase [Sanguibacter keddieii DSM 10542]|uniref:Phosphoglycerate dehydrogenase-like oxidoreductase n=1 Tax=Sanguibacter keddieii (strain ATCC 51767 / DSM 10542 / NCFB 3025 / ST-74) TaxID=446469 RepID=D1BDL4_SANKS|nr:phosphoglycerate dehydrogenase [Sanguibacter keddieii]ACZ21076.1 phosphoglycerate dehydrogenase-like oxidoreductase [Sanguibacter keddieii DSM 10542]